jgi:hypothetical protein
MAAMAETGSVISSTLRLLAFVCCALIVASFAMFARDQMAGASQHQQTALVAGSGVTGGAATSGTDATAPQKPHAQPRQFIDSAAHTLTAPFSGIAPSNNPWVKYGLPAILALLAYGVGLGYLARYAAVH